MKWFLYLFCTVTLTAAPSIKLAWDMDPGSSFTNIALYWGPVSGQPTNHILVGAVTNTVFTNLTVGGHYYFTVTSLGNGMESLPSNEVEYIVPMAPPTNLRFTTTIQTSSDLKTWKDTGQLVMTENTNIAFYRVNMTSLPSKSITPLTTKGISWPFGSVRMAPTISQPPTPFK